MAIATMDDLAALPDGTRLYVADGHQNDGRTWTKEGSGLTDGTYRIRLDFLSGAVRTGRVMLESDLPPKIGSMFHKSRYWYIVVTEPTNGEMDMAVFTNEGASWYGWVRNTVSSMRRYRVEESPAWYSTGLLMATQMWENKTQLSVMQTQVNEALGQVHTVQRELEQVAALKTALRSFLDEPKPKKKTANEVW